MGSHCLSDELALADEPCAARCSAPTQKGQHVNFWHDNLSNSTANY